MRTDTRCASTYTLYYGTVVDTPVLGYLHIQRNMLIGVTSEGRIDFLHQYGSEQQAIYSSPQDFFQWQSGSNRVQNGPGAPNHNHRNNKDCYEHGYEFVDFSRHPSKFLVPGFFDTHIHASQFPNIGLGSELPLLDWLEHYTFALENKFCSPDPSKSAEQPKSKTKRLQMARNIYSKVISRTLSAGTTTAAYYATIDIETTKILADLAVEKGQRALVGKVCMDCNPTFPAYKEESPEILIAGTLDVLEHCTGLNASVQHTDAPKMVQGIISPRFAPSCLRELMRKLGEVASQYNAPVQTHISENKDEIRLVSDLFPDCNDYTAVYEQHGLLGALTILAHAVHLTKAECRTILQRKCSILHCPSLNTFLTSGVAPVKRYLYEDKINVSLGTDVSGGCEHLVLLAMKGLIMVLHHKEMQEKLSESSHSGDNIILKTDKNSVTVADALYMATMGGAIACGMGEELGSFLLGKWFDAQLIDVMSPDLNFDSFDLEETAEKEVDAIEQARKIIHRWVFCGDDRNCVKVWCNGRKVVDKEERWVYVG